VECCPGRLLFSTLTVYTMPSRPMSAASVGSLESRFETCAISSEQVVRLLSVSGPAESFFKHLAVPAYINHRFLQLT
jgi:hypothetical protein